MSAKKEKDFIRGKSGLQTTTSSDANHKKTTGLQTKDQLFGVRKRRSDRTADDTRKAKKRQKKSKNDSEDLLENDDKVVIESMSLSRLPEGIVIYGCIQEISDFDLKFSVCGGIVATVSITDISSPYTRLLQIFTENESMVSSDIEVLKPNGMFKIGQYFPIKILSKSKKSESFSTIEFKASMNPKDIYQDCKTSSLLRVPQMPIIAAVDSIEDHGYVMDIGLEDIKAFLAKDRAQSAIKAFKGRQSLSVGQLVLCSIESVANERSIVLTTNSKITDFKLLAKHETDISCLIPGLTVSATVMNVGERGLEVYILNTFKGFITRNHLKNDWELPKNMYKIGDKIDGTVLYRHPITKQIALSLKSTRNVKSITNFIQNAKIGRIYENAIVMGRDDTGNYVFKLDDGLKAICSKKRLLDKYNEDIELENKFAIGSSHRCRVLAINIMDALVVVTLKQSSLEFPNVSDENLKVGALFRGKVKKMTKNGAVVQIAFGVTGFVPNIHLSETASIKNREQLFPKGKVVTCRIYRMDKSCTPMKVNLTCKKTLINSKLNLLTSYEDAKPGLQTEGVIVLITTKGILVEFFNGVKGFIPLKYLSTYKIQDPTDVFTVGQIVKCTVVSVELESERITCSLIKVKDKLLNNLNKNLKIGQILTKLKISKKMPNSLELTDQSNNVKVLLPFGHLSDDIDVTQLLRQTLKIGDHIKEVMVFTIKASLVIVTRKATFIKSSKNNQLIASLDKLEPNLTIPVVINGFATYGIFVEMPNNIRGLVNKRLMTDGPIDEPKNLGFVLHQTVFARFIGFEEQSATEENEEVKKKLKFSLKLSHVWDRRKKPFDDRVDMFGNYVKDFDYAMKTLRKSGEEIDRKLTNFKVGGVVSYRVVSLENSLIECEVRLENDKKDNSVKGFGLTEGSETELKVGSSGIAIVAEIDFTNKSVVILIRPKCVKQVKNSIKINAIASVKCEQTVKCSAIYVCNKYVLALLAGHVPGLVAYIPSKRHLNDRIGISQHFSVNETYHIVIKAIVDSTVICVLKPQTKDKTKRQLKEVVETTSQPNDETTDNSEKENESERDGNVSAISSKPEKRKYEKQEEKTQNDDSTNKVLKVNKPFIWSEEESDSGLDNNESDTDSEEDDSEDNKRRKTRKERNEEARRQEEELREREASQMDPNRTPETVEDLERSVLSSPNSSMVWLKYMAFHAEQAELAKARDVAERALKTISFRDETERLNIWKAFLTLENMYGTQQTLDQLFERALQYNEPVVIYRHLANIYVEANKEELTEQLYTTMTKKFKQNKSVWIDFGMYYMKNNRLESARKLLQRCLTLLEKRDHIEVISKFAQMECQWGDVEQAKTLFEKVLANFPKRIDLWSVYIDMMLKYGLKRHPTETEDWVRNIFERVITFKLSAKRMKFVFKRYIDFEKQFNNFERIERIKEKANEYVEGSQLE